MKAITIVAPVLASLVFLQGVPAPVFAALGTAIAAGGAAGAAAGVAASGISAGIISGVVGGIVSGGVSVGVTCAVTKSCKHRRSAYIHARQMARELRKELGVRRDGAGPAPPGVPQHNWDDCYNDALKGHITITGPVNENDIRVEGLPTSCMVLATVLDGNTSGGPTPIPCGTSCMDWTGMTPEYYEEIRGIINAQILNQ
ncbi:uncharacterized protein CIMG_09000 [Coccidioides immitis RS]|uniref:Uncharacterized protein n=4 Tax=Coccidioides immitis TaxID=5501 RepID=J3K1F0_COCIM|nr:uncharacterized protein CIMG_09000 [Coccidioides immitis RS]KMP08583.1 hypothetical protein CIRG_08264 [Coccidioides immitis RMSCC 2394]KMU78584.1 hypothetical protein CISG_01624 [Coccidioides immitis RMSCC 3703]KMU87398.1 hypothetical protein CIHG_05192 [Coccidioides immitis H538.4]TPX20507.1 hypothetical protein DIZ76_016397 [Coccidioides immitis]EAS27796.3 hypothetical protein CIMG_09000 [Coccidioides immitis RS]